jgi:hypothetical protein
MLISSTTRDWRGIKHPLGAYSREDLANALACASHTLEQVGRFIEEIESELAQRGEPSGPRVA